MDLPLPRVLLLLWLAVPFTLLGGYGLAARLTAERALRAGLTPVVTLAVWLLSVHAAALASGSFPVGLCLGTLGAAAVGIASSVWPPRPPAGARPPLTALLAIAVAAIPIAWMAIGWSFHDEDLYAGHMAIAAELQNGAYPPRHLTFPSEPLRYHYGFDLLVACVTALTRVSVIRGIDVAVVLLWGVTGAVLWGLGELWFRRGWLVVLVVLFAGGAPFCLAESVPRAKGMLGLCHVGVVPALAPMVSSFFQHPWSLGLPVALAMMLIASARGRMQRGPRLAALALLGGLLPLAHVVLFVTVLPCIVAAELVHAWASRARLGATLDVVAATAAAVGIRVATGSIAGSTMGTTWSSSVTLTRGVAGELPASIAWHVQSYGLALPASLVGLFLLPACARPLVATLLGGSLFGLNVVRYAHSDDALKLGTVAQLAIALATSALASRLLDAARAQVAARRGAIFCAAALSSVGASAGGLSFASVFFSEAIGRYYARAVPPLPPDDARAAAYLRTRVVPGELVYRREGPAIGYARWAGLSVPWADWATSSAGFSAERIRARTDFLHDLPDDAGSWSRERIVWLVLEPRDVRLATIAARWTASGAAREVWSSGPLRIVALEPR